jgi:hypothetical protein
MVLGCLVSERLWGECCQFYVEVIEIVKYGIERRLGSMTSSTNSPTTIGQSQPHAQIGIFVALSATWLAVCVCLSGWRREHL